MKRPFTTLAVVCMAVVLALNSFGCNLLTPNQTPQQQLTVLSYDIAVVRSVVAAQPAGPRREALLKQLDAAASYTDLAAVVAALAQVGTPTTLPTDTAARITATK